MIYIKTPGTTANMGPGFDAIGMALSIYNNLWVEETDGGLQIEIKHEQPFKVPTDETNLIYRIMKDFYSNIGKTLPGLKIIQEDYIPMTRGLGSSAACIVSGLLAANELSGAGLDRFELLQIAAKIEGHPDNVAPAFLGEMVVGAMDHKMTKFVKIAVPSEMQFAVMIPAFQLLTEEARAVLPKQIPLKDAVFNTSRAALMVASVMSGNWDNLDLAMDDCLHQPYRAKLIPNMENIFEHAKKLGAKGAFLSGGGPTLIAVIEGNDNFEPEMKKYLFTLPDAWALTLLAPDAKGAILKIL